ncbi:Secreted protein [Paraburkholderia ribeironis]|uniref:Secreted protein n=1 Tax=Paraburkholderia ribeironis TaxID=1247936 RepID=A0A1N7S921_9BURK|nr:lactonase family protein [Paraburkholderia ribeironis]SIT43875.1 Secreted protein [Paraburkholderia ribeironis]
MSRLFQKNSVTRLGVVVLAVLTLSAGMVDTTIRAATLPTPAHTEFVYVGTSQSQISALRFDTSTGQLTAIGPVAQGLKSTWVAAHPDLPILYAVDDDSTKEGSITAYAADRGTGALTRVNAVLTGGRGTTYLRFDPASMTLLGANYNSGSVSSVAVNPDGSVGELVSTIAETGSGPNRRQASAHAHSIAIDPSGKYALVPDLGADRVFIYRFDRATHALSQDDDAHPHAFIAPSGSGPRHIEFGANGRFVYLLTELNAEIMVFRWDASQKELTFVQALPITSQTFDGVKSAAEIAVSHDGRFVYVENRAENSLMVYGVSPDTGELSLVQRVSSGGDKPWGFGIDSSGRWLLVANQRSGKVNVFSIDPVSGKVADTGQSADVPGPTSVAFVK